MITELGLMIVDMLTNYFKDIIDIPFSAELETELDEIAEHKADKTKILEKFYVPFSKLMEKADKEIEAVEAPVEVSDVKCEKCGRMMVIKQGRFGKFLACPGFPECRNRSRFCIRSVLSALNAAVKLSSARQKRAVFFMAVPIIRNVNLHHGTGQQKKNVRNAVK